ncbi:hypothetical protein Sango_1210300 [Sesamum angolense]|uniref:Retrotransposon gag domain-containing protein n=1 Tax=Sesamum angolense TaxID=2727404 RepID=A0AAE2BX69_9LAMI|nr:hypothetical protein Sango_1210300 [Sesamum angolense]
MRPQGVTEEQVKLRAFPFSLGDKAKDWLYSLPSGTIVSWNELKKQFLENYFPASRTTNIRKDISGIRQFSGESFYEYWGRFKQLVESCPHHQIPDHLLIQYFYEGLFEANRSLVDAASGGALYDKTPTEARKLITTMAANNQQFGNRSDNPPRKVHEVSTSVDERLDKLTFLVEKILVGGTQQVKTCGICTSSGHFTDACPTLQEEPTMHANAVGGFSGPSQRGHDPFSNTYNPGWRDHPNLRYGNQPQNFQRPPYQQPPPPQTNSNSGTSLEDMMKILVANTQQFQQETRASIQNLESQVSQLASSVSRLESQGVVIQLADRSIAYPVGVLEDILVQVNELIFPADFYVLDMTENTSPNSTSILLGRPFLKTSKTKIDVDARILSMEFDNEVVSFNIGGVTQNSSDIHSVFLIDFIDPLVRGNAIFDGGEHSR